MKTRIEEIQIEGRATVRQIEVKGKGVHHFKLPPMSVGYRLIELLNEARQTGRPSAMYEASAAVLGRCWFHETLELETEWPVDDDDPALRRYAIAVQEELAEAGYNMIQVRTLATEILSSLTESMKADTAAAAEAVEAVPFSEAPPVESVSLSSNAVCSDPATPAPPGAPGIMSSG